MTSVTSGGKYFKCLSLGASRSKIDHLYRSTVSFARGLQFEMDVINKELDKMQNKLKTTMQGLNKVDDIGGPLLGK